MISKDELSKQAELVLNELMFELEKAREHTNYDINKNNYKCLSERGKYLVEINSLICKMNELLRDIKKVLIFIRRFPNPKYFIDNDIDNIDYIKYHLEMLTNKTHNILEIMRLTINSVYELGLSTNDCSWNNLKLELDINSNVMQIVNLYHKSFKDVINIRHSNIHQGKDVDPITTNMQSDLSLIRTRVYYWSIDKRNTNDYYFTSSLLKHKTKEYKKERVEYVKSVIRTAEHYIDLFSFYIYKETYKRAILK